MTCEMMGAIVEVKILTDETNTGFPVVEISARVILGKRGEIRCVDTGSLRDQILKAVVSTVAIVEAKGGAK